MSNDSHHHLSGTKVLMSYKLYFCCLVSTKAEVGNKALDLDLKDFIYSDFHFYKRVVEGSFQQKQQLFGVDFSMQGANPQ